MPTSYISTSEAAQMIPCGPVTRQYIVILLGNGRIKGQLVGNRWRVDEQSLKTFRPLHKGGKKRLSGLNPVVEREDAIQREILDFVRDNPGERIQDIAAAISKPVTTTWERVRRMIEAGALYRDGDGELRANST
jgi:hypothetical protein